jgi:cytochrome c peroxidase
MVKIIPWLFYRIVCELQPARRATILAATALTLIGISSCPSRSDSAPQASSPAPWSLGLPVPDPTGFDPEMAKFGSFLFSSPLLSGDATVACASCHKPELAYSGPESVAVGIHGQNGTRHPPPLVNLYGATSLMLDGRARSLDDQVVLPLESPSEMAVDWTVSLRRLKDLPEARSFLAEARTSILTKGLVLRSLATYVRSLVSGGSPFDRYYYLGDQSAISEQAKEGLELFIRRGRCSGCHTINGYSAPLTDGNFHSVGVGFAQGTYRDVGRSAVTGLLQDLGKFKTPTLRNVASRKYFMHDGSMTSLRKVMDYYNKGGNPGATNLDGRVQPLHLNSEEEDAIIAFLQTLSAPIESRDLSKPVGTAGN